MVVYKGVEIISTQGVVFPTEKRRLMPGFFNRKIAKIFHKSIEKHIKLRYFMLFLRFFMES